MPSVERSSENPIIIPDSSSSWESQATFNPSVIEINGTFHALFRAVADERSSIGHTTSTDGLRFEGKTQLIAPTEPWEKYGCEDPRVTAFEGKYFIFYTAVEAFAPDGIKVAVAITEDFVTIKEKHLVTPFNAKAMALFPERINGKIAAIITVNTDRPPAKICLAFFDTIEQIWSKEYWNEWYAHLDDHIIPLGHNEKDHIEVGSAPIKTKSGWLIFYSYIYNYFTPPAVFGIQATLLKLEDPRVVVGEVKRPFLVPQEEYEIYGRIPSIVFPSGALIKGSSIYLYYGAADTTSCVALLDTKEFLKELIFISQGQFHRSEKNPIILPIAEHAWEAQAAFNPAALYDGDTVHILYRAMSNDNTSTVGYASSSNGIDILERLSDPIYVPRESFESKGVPGGNSGCEDPRVTQIGDTVYMCYTAYDGKNPPRVALTSIPYKKFKAREWEWTTPILISPIGKDDKDAALFPKKIGGKYVFLHRLGSEIWIDTVDDLEFKNGATLGGAILMHPRETAWDSKKIGIAAPPIETKYGWLLLYHGVSRRGGHYNVRAALLDLKDPSKVLCRTHDPLLEPKMDYERNGIIPNVVFPCGAALIKKMLFVYYGGADKVVGVATIDIDILVDGLRDEMAVG